MNTVPTYSLYGATAEERLAEQLHWESIAERSRLHSWEIKPHRHDHFFQILHIRGGTGEALLDDRRVALAGACVVTVPPHCVHGFVFSEDIDGIVVTITERYCHTLLASAPEVMPQFDAPQRCALAAPHDDDGLAHALDLFGAELARIAPWRNAVIGALLSVVLVGLARQLAAQSPALRAQGGRVLRHFQRFQQLVESSFATRRELAGYAAALGVTATQLNRVCRGVAGKTALDIINDRIVVEAQRNLLYTELDIKQIALTLGFADASYFTRFFAKQVGQTPTEFRIAARAQLDARHGKADRRAAMG